MKCLYEVWGYLKKFPNKSIVICPQDPVNEESLQAVCLKTDPGCSELNEISRYSCRSIHNTESRGRLADMCML